MMLASVSRTDGTHVGVIDVSHGVDGWVLVDMEWSPESGLATYDYLQYDDHGRHVAAACAIVRQPYTVKHEGWSELWNQPERRFGMY